MGQFAKFTNDHIRGIQRRHPVLERNGRVRNAKRGQLSRGVGEENGGVGNNHIVTINRYRQSCPVIGTEPIPISRTFPSVGSGVAAGCLEYQNQDNT
jgi:hypothetical protein